MTNGTHAPSAIAGDTYPEPSYGGALLQIAIPWLASAPAYGDLPRYWSWQRDVALANTIHREDMWASAVARTATKFAAHGFTIKDSQDSARRVAASQELFKRADGGQGWVSFAQKVMTELLTVDNGIFIRLRHADDEVVKVKVYQGDKQGFAEVTQSSPGAKITGLYHLDSLRCMRTGNLTYPVRYQPVMGAPQLLRWDQVLMYADQPSPRAELLGVGFCATSRAYKTINTIAGLRQLLHEFVTGGGANKLVFIQGLQEHTLNGLINTGTARAQAKGLVYFLSAILGAVPGDVPVEIKEVILKSLPQGFDPKQILDDAYLIYANAIGVPVQDIQPLSGQGLGTGKQTEILQDVSRGVGIAAFLKWWEQTVSDRVLPATTELTFDDEHDLRDQKARAEVRNIRAGERATRIQSGEITPAIARQLAADSEDLPQELLAADATPGGQISDDEKPTANVTPSPAALELMQGALNALPAQRPALKSSDDLLDRELADARALAGWAKGE